MDARRWRNEAIEMYVCKFPVGSEKLKFDKVMSVYKG